MSKYRSFTQLHPASSNWKSLRKLYRIALRIKLGRRVRPPPKISA
ncbi:MAG: hypothetical protein ABSB71_06015 [Candidatus Bathyarchaeia archaeon]